MPSPNSQGWLRRGSLQLCYFLCYFLVHHVALHLCTRGKMVKTCQREKFHRSNSELTSCCQAVVHTHTARDGTQSWLQVGPGRPNPGGEGRKVERAEAQRHQGGASCLKGAALSRGFPSHLCVTLRAVISRMRQ